jgi:hypothetical protein
MQNQSINRKFKQLKKWRAIYDTSDTSIFPEFAAANDVTPRTTEEVVDREP